MEGDKVIKNITKNYEKKIEELNTKTKLLINEINERNNEISSLKEKNNQLNNQLDKFDVFIFLFRLIILKKQQN